MNRASRKSSIRRYLVAILRVRFRFRRSNDWRTGRKLSRATLCAHLRSLRSFSISRDRTCVNKKQRPVTRFFVNVSHSRQSDRLLLGRDFLPEFIGRPNHGQVHTTRSRFSWFPADQQASRSRRFHSCINLIEDDICYTMVRAACLLGEH